MSQDRYARKLSVGGIPAVPARARLLVRYTPEAAARGETAENAALLADNLALFAPLVARGFLGAADLRFRVDSPAPDVIEVQLHGAPLTRGMVVMAFRLTVALHDADPAQLAMLIHTLGDEDVARSVWGGFDFDTGIAGLELTAADDQGHAEGPPFDPLAPAGEVIGAARLTVPGWAALMPDAGTEDAILRLSGLRAFLPPRSCLSGAGPDYEPGEEEWLAAGPDLCIDNLSMETGSLHALLACLGPAPVPGLQIAE